MYLWSLFLCLWGLCAVHVCHPSTIETFVVSFQSSAEGSHAPSTDEWMEYSKTIPPSTEFSACNWMKVKYFSRDIAVMLWSYCTKETPESSMNCLELVLRNRIDTANRHLEATGYFPWSRKTSKKAKAEIIPYAHRLSLIHI